MRKIDQRNFIRALSLASLSVGAMILTPPVHAAPVAIPGISTLQDLINAGHSGITVGDKNYYDFTYAGAPLASASPSPANPAPTASQISVTQPDASIQGFRFSYNWNSTTFSGNNQDSLISYSVHVLDTSPQNFIETVGLDFGATAGGGILDNSTVSEKVLTLDGTGTYGTLNVKEFGPGNPNNVDSAAFDLPGGIRDLRLTKDIAVHSSSTTFQQGFATIAYVDNTFKDVPEPVAGSFLMVGAGMLLVRRRKLV
ncbi:MAG: hypothetical protein JWO87_1654 [Phycisphaerales bacterium]|nr:hypothetical protein [Phycisphaerales bacterium]